MSQSAYADQRPASVDELSFLVAAAEKNNTAVITGAPGRIPPDFRRAETGAIPPEPPADATRDIPSEPRTGGTPAPRAVTYVDLKSMDRVIEYSVPDQVIHVETGITLGALSKLLSENDQWWPVDLPDDWTLLDALNIGESGSFEHRFSSVRDLVLGCTVVAGSAGVIKCGGRVVKNVTGYDMTKLFVGSRSTLGIPVSAQLRLYAKPAASRTVKWDSLSLDGAVDGARKLAHSGLPLTAVSIVEGSLMARAQGIADVVDEVVDAASKLVDGGSVIEDDNEIWSSVTETFRHQDSAELVAVAASSTVLRKVLPALPGKVEVRPAFGSVRLIGTSLEEVGKMVQPFAAELTPIVVAGADDQYNYVVRRFPPDDAVRARLRSSLKDQFDPHRILNPFVSL